MKKYTHPYYNTSLVISSNGATNYLISFSNSKFITTSFDSRIFFEKASSDESGLDDIFNVFINEFQYNNDILWFNNNI